MKRLCLLLLFLPFLSYSQDIPKKANTIIISVPDSNLLVKASQVLFNNGYTISTANKDLMIITTEPKEVKSCNVKLSVSVRGNSIHINGQYNVPEIDPSFFRIEYKGMKGSPNMIAWEEMNKVASLLEGEREYLIK